MITRLTEIVEGIRQGELCLGPILIITQREESRRQRSAFEFGRETHHMHLTGERLSEPLAPVRHLRSV